MKKILLLETIAPEALELLKRPDIELFEAYRQNVDQILSKNNIEAIITRGIGKVNTELLAKCPNLQTATRCGVGLDNVDVAACTSKNIKVINAPGVNIDTVAEHTLAMILMLERDLLNSIKQVKKGEWSKRNEYKGDEIKNKTLGIIGLGNIGKRVAELASAFKMNIIYTGPEKMELPYKYVKFEELLMQSDMISLHVPLTPETTHLINKSALSMMKPSAILINNARGAVVNENDLYEALKSKKIKAYAADVMENEPPDAENPLLKLPNVYITAHLASLTKNTYIEMCTSTVKNTLGVLFNEGYDPKSIFNFNDLK